MVDEHSRLEREVSIIAANIPLLIGNDTLGNLGNNFMNDASMKSSHIFFRITKKIIKKKEYVHWKLNIIGIEVKYINPIYVGMQNKNCLTPRSKLSNLFSIL